MVPVMRVDSLRCVALGGLLTSVACGGATGLPPNIGVAGDGTLDAVLEFIRADNDLPSLGAVLLRGQQVVEMGAVGVRAQGAEESVSTSDRWHLGSLTKAMTATLAARLVEQGAIAWNTTVQSALPGLAGTIRSDYLPVTLDELLYHVSGLPEDVTVVPIWSTLRSDTSSLVSQRYRWASELLSLEPQVSRGSHLYTNAGYIVAGAMLEQVTGDVWEDLVVRELFGPLGMTSSGFGAPGSPGAVPDQPRGHLREDGAWVALAPGPGADNPPAIGPAGTVHTTLADYALYLSAHLAGARGADGLVSSATFAKLHEPAAGTDYALGWSVTDRGWAGGRALTHRGTNTVWFAVTWIAPARDFAMLTVTNAGGEGASRGVDLAIQTLIERFEAAFP